MSTSHGYNPQAVAAGHLWMSLLPTGGQRTCTQLTSVQSQGRKKGTNPDRHDSEGIHVLNGKAHFYNTLHH